MGRAPVAPVSERRVQAPSAPSPARRPARALDRGLTLAVLIPIAAVYLWAALLAHRGLSGDEPHYLAITQGLWLYHTLDQHRVLYHHDFFSYYPRLMSSHALHRAGRLYPLHPLGLPILLLPGFALAGAAGALVTVALLGILLCWRTLHLARRVAGPVPAALAVLVMGLTAPFALNAASIYPDVASGLALMLAYEALDAPVLTVRRALALGLLLALAPWLHIKLLVAVGAYMLWALYALIYGRPRRAAPRPFGGTVLAAALALDLPLLSVAGIVIFNGAVYGSFSLTAQFTLRGQSLMTGNPLGGMVGQLFAQGQGALGTAPFLLLAIPGAVVLWRRDTAAALKIALVTIPFWLITLTYRDWWGGDCPPLRYLMPLLPLWTAGIAALFDSLRTPAARLVVALLSVATLALSLAIPLAPKFGWALADGRGALLVALGKRLGLPLWDWLPRFQPAISGPGSWHGAALIPLWIAALLVLWALVAWRERRAHALRRQAAHAAH